MAQYQKVIQGRDTLKKLPGMMEKLGMKKPLVIGSEKLADRRTLFRHRGEKPPRRHRPSAKPGGGHHLRPCGVRASFAAEDAERRVCEARERRQDVLHLAVTCGSASRKEASPASPHGSGW